jgi:CO/xanthine dehydrogenase FAD-binding subunit
LAEATAVKPAPFHYVAAGSLEEALELLRHEDARPLAGGQSLVPMLNFRLARPSLLVDLNPIGELAGIEVDHAGTLGIGALTRQSRLLAHPAVAARWPLLGEALAAVGHPAIRNRGTVGGSVAHADPAAELPVALLALDARLHLRRAGSQRTVGVAEFARGAMTTCLEDGELLVAIDVPPPPAGARMAFREHARTHGDFALAGAAVVRAPARSGSAVALLGADAVPRRASEAEAALDAGAPPAEVGRLAAREVADGYRQALLAELVRRAAEATGA